MRRSHNPYFQPPMMMMPGPMMPGRQPYVKEYKLPPHQAAELLHRKYPTNYPFQARNNYPTADNYGYGYSSRPPVINEGHRAPHYDSNRYYDRPSRHDAPLVTEVTSAPHAYDDLVTPTHHYGWTPGRYAEDVTALKEPYDMYPGRDWYDSKVYSAEVPLYMPERPRSTPLMY